MLSIHINVYFLVRIYATAKQSNLASWCIPSKLFARQAITITPTVLNESPQAVLEQISTFNMCRITELFVHFIYYTTLCYTL